MFLVLGNQLRAASTSGAMQMCSRGIATSVPAAAAAEASSISPGFIEMRDYTLKPEHMAKYIELGGVAVEAPSQFEYTKRTVLQQFIEMYTPETGDVLNRIVHFYAYDSLNTRDRCRKGMLQEQQWNDFLQRSRPYVLGPQKSVILTEAASLYSALDMKPTAQFTPPDDDIKGTYEMRQYQLEPGYSTMGQVVDLLEKGLPHKVGTMSKAGVKSVPVFFAYTEIGTLNMLIEMWRHPSPQGSIEARIASRDSAEWQNSVNSIAPHVQNFRTELMRPVWFSPWQ